MTMLLTTLAFLAATVVAVLIHMKGRSPAVPAAMVPSGPPCPRCGAATPAEAVFCPGCGVPRQVYEVVDASAALNQTANDGQTSSLHAVVRADLCVGCGACVAACPEEGAIYMNGKLAVVNLAKCSGHGSCAESCPVGGILMAAGDAVHKVEVPEVTANFESNVRGVFIAGELGGRGLIKNAVNEGKLAIESIGEELSLAAGSDSSRSDPLDVIIVGSGPAGLSAGLEAHRRGLTYTILEQGDLADTIRKYPRHKLLLAEPVRIPLYGDLWVADSSKEALIRIWETIVAETGLRIQTRHKVEAISGSEGIFLVEAAGARFRARRILLALGRRGTPRRLGVPGEDLAKVFYDIAEMEEFRGRRVLVVGGGDSAIEAALGVANQDGAEVSLSYRGEDFKRARERNRRRLEEAVDRGKIRLMLRSRLLEIRETEVRFEREGEAGSLANDDVIVRIGGEPPFPLLERIGIRMIHKDLPLPTGG